MCPVGRTREPFSDTWITAKGLAAKHGYLVAWGYFCFRSLAKVSGWGVGAYLTRFLARRWPGFAAWGFDETAKKATPRSQDVRVLAGVVATVGSCVLIQYPNIELLVWLAVAVVVWHLIGIVVYHVNVLFFDEFYRGSDPRVWSYRRVFFQAAINLAESVFIFAGLYQFASQKIGFGQAIFWSVQGFTLNVPYQWQEVRLAITPLEVSVWGLQVGMSIFFFVIVLGLIGSVVFDRPEIAEKRTTDE